MSYIHQTSIRLRSTTRHFLECQARGLGTSLQATIAMILGGAADRSAATAATSRWPETTPERFLYLAQMHKLSLPDAVDLMEEFGFKLSALGSPERLMRLLTHPALSHVAQIFAVDLEWLAAGAPSIIPRRLWTERDLHNQLVAAAGADLHPTVTLLRAPSDLRQGPPEMPLLAAVRRVHHTPFGTPFVTLQAWPFDLGPERVCTPALLCEVSALCRAQRVPLRGLELPLEQLVATAQGTQIAVQALHCVVPEVWSPNAEVGHF